MLPETVATRKRLSDLVKRTEENVLYGFSQTKEPVEGQFSNQVGCGTIRASQDVGCCLMNQGTNRFSSIDDAFDKLKKGTYGICEDCKNLIQKERLEAVPDATRCIDCQKQREEKEKRMQ